MTTKASFTDYISNNYFNHLLTAMVQPQGEKGESLRAKDYLL